jgi:sugar phosphate isomerase/epimerase
LPFEEVFEALNEIGYDGWIAAEVLPHPDPDAAAEQAVRFLRPRASRQYALPREV